MKHLYVSLSIGNFCINWKVIPLHNHTCAIPTRVKTISRISSHPWPSSSRINSKACSQASGGSMFILPFTDFFTVSLATFALSAQDSYKSMLHLLPISGIKNAKFRPVKFRKNACTQAIQSVYIWKEYTAMPRLAELAESMTATLNQMC